MNKYHSTDETVDLALPLNGAYVSSARLTVASIANRMGFDVDEIEDLKAAVAEACIYIIKKSPTDYRGTFQIQFVMLDNALEVNLDANTFLDFEKFDDEMGLLMIKALTDELNISHETPKKTRISMLKHHKHTTF